MLTPTRVQNSQGVVGFASLRSGKVRTVAIVFLFSYALFFPTFQSSFGSFGAIFVNGGLLASGLYYLIVIQRGQIPFLCHSEKSIALLIIICLFYYQLAIPFSMFLSQQVITRDLYELHRPLLYVVIFLLPFMMVRNHRQLNLVANIFTISFLFIALLAINQYLNINDALSALYTKEHNIQTGRISAPFLNPYDLAIIALFYFLLFSAYLVRQIRMHYLLLWFSSIAVIVFTQSRGVVASFALAVVVFVVVCLLFLLPKARRRIPTSRPMLSILAMSCLFGVFSFGLFSSYGSNLHYLVNGYERLLSGDSLGSLDTRLKQMEIALDLANSNVFIALFGNGPSKGIMEFVESSYTYYMFRYGLAGLVICYFLPLLVAIFVSVRSLLLRNYSPAFPLALSILIWLLILPVASVTNNFTDQIRISFIYYFLVGLAIRMYFLHKYRNSIQGIRLR
jgi:hypothetical protein